MLAYLFGHFLPVERALVTPEKRAEIRERRQTAEGRLCVMVVFRRISRICLIKCTRSRVAAISHGMPAACYYDARQAVVLSPPFR